MNGYYELVAAVLRKNGFNCRRQKGSHQTWCKGRVCVTVSTTCKSRHTANQIMKDAGIDHHFG